MAIEPAEYNHRNMIPFCAAEAIKYLSRYRFKNGAEDLKKAVHFCQMILDFEYAVGTKVEYSDDLVRAAGEVSSQKSAHEEKVEEDSGEFLKREPIKLSCGDVSVPFKTSYHIDTSVLDLSKGPATGELWAFLYDSLLKQTPAVITDLLNQKTGLDFPVPTAPYVAERRPKPQADAMQRAAEQDEDEKRVKCCLRNLVGEPVMTVAGLKRYSGSIQGRRRVVPGSIKIVMPCQSSDESMVVTDDKDGNLVGDVDQEGALVRPRVDYDRGLFEFTFGNPPLAGEVVYCYCLLESDEKVRSTS